MHSAGFFIMEHNMSDIAAVMKACEIIEAQLVKFANKTEVELKNSKQHICRLRHNG